MNCNNCARHVSDAIQGVPGVRSATVLLDAGRASVRWDSGAEQNASAVIEAVRKAGYTAKEIQADTSASGEVKPANWQINLWLGVAVTAALMAGEWGFGFGRRPCGTALGRRCRRHPRHPSLRRGRLDCR